MDDELPRRALLLVEAHEEEIASLFRNAAARALARPLVMVDQRRGGDTAIMFMTVDEVVLEAPADATRARLEGAPPGADVILVIIDGLGRVVLSSGWMRPRHN